MNVKIPDYNLGVAVSGGMDSMALLSLYVNAGYSPIVINVEHGIRGENSLRDSEFVKKFCENHNLQLCFRSVNALEYAKKYKISVELAARHLRYEFFDSLISAGTVDKIALAHHADDNAETILMREFRGTGIRGLKGVTERDRYIRPLLKYSRADIECYVEKNGVPYVNDETNGENTYTRNFLRNELIPLIKTRYPAVISALTRLSENAAEADDFISKYIVPAEKTDMGYKIPDLFLQENVIKKYSINACMNKMGVYQDVEFCHQDAMLSLSDKENNASVDLPYGVTAVKYGNDLIFYKRSDETFVETAFSPEKNFAYKGFKYSFIPYKEMVAGVTFDLNKADGSIIRTRRDGDYFCRVNGKNKLLSDFLNDKKLTKAEKDSLLVLARGNTVIAVLGLEIGEEIKIDKDTKKILRIYKEKL